MLNRTTWDKQAGIMYLCCHYKQKSAVPLKGWAPQPSPSKEPTGALRCTWKNIFELGNCYCFIFIRTDWANVYTLLNYLQLLLCYFCNNDVDESIGDAVKLWRKHLIPTLTAQNDSRQYVELYLNIIVCTSYNQAGKGADGNRKLTNWLFHT